MMFRRLWRWLRNTDETDALLAQIQVMQVRLSKLIEDQAAAELAKLMEGRELMPVDRITNEQYRAACDRWDDPDCMDIQIPMTAHCPWPEPRIEDVNYAWEPWLFDDESSPIERLEAYQELDTLGLVVPIHSTWDPKAQQKAGMRYAGRRELPDTACKLWWQDGEGVWLKCVPWPHPSATRMDCPWCKIISDGAGDSIASGTAFVEKVNQLAELQEAEFGRLHR